MSNRFEPRRPINPVDFEGSQYGPESPPYSVDAGPPSPTYPYYERYGPPRAGPSYRGDMSYTNTYRAEAWRPDHAGPSLRPPTPDRYPPARFPRQDIRPRPTRFESPPRIERRIPSDPSYDATWPRTSRDTRDTMAERMFEPSDSWKQAHNAGDQWEQPRDGKPRLQASDENLFLFPKKPILARNEKESSHAPPLDEQDSLASTPHDEDQLSRAPTPDASKSPSSPEAASAEPTRSATRPWIRRHEPLPSIARTLQSIRHASGESTLQALSTTPPPGILPEEPVVVIPPKAEVTAEPELPEPPEPVTPIVDSLEPSAPGTPAMDSDNLEPVGRKLREHVPVRTSRRSQKATAVVPAITAVTETVEEPGDDVSIAPTPPPVTMQDTLRMFVIMRLQNGRQTREERVLSVLGENETTAATQDALSRPSGASGEDSAPPRDVVDELMDDEHSQARQTVNDTVRPSLQARFALRQADLHEKVTRLRQEYLELHERWQAHCAKLDDVAKAGAMEEATQNPGRTTRRSTATLGDAVRSDLEMEQIIMNLGIEELTDANHLAARNAAVIPDMISVDTNPKGGMEEHLHNFDDTNNLVDDPDAFYAPRTGLWDWSNEEKRIFLEKYAAYPKQFGIIADFLPLKTPAQCVTYYYFHKHEIDFRKVVAKFTHGKKRRGRGATGKNRRNALLSDILQRDAEFSREHTPAVLTPAPRRPKPVSVVSAVEGALVRRSSANRRGASGLAENTPGSTPTPTPDPEPEGRRKRRRVTAARAVAVVEQDEADEAEPAKRGRRSKRVKVAESTVTTTSSTPVMTSAELAPLDAKTPEQVDGGRKKFALASATWSDEDKAQLISLLGRFGDDFKRIAASLPTKTTAQITAFYKANSVEMKLDQIMANATRRSITPDQSKGSFYKDISAAYPGSRVLSSDILPQVAGSSSIPPMLEMSSLPISLGGQSQSMETRFRLNSITAGRSRDGLGLASESLSMPGPSTYHYRPEGMHPQFGSHSQGITPPPMASLNPNHSPAFGSHHSSHHIANPSPFASPQPPSLPAPSTLTTTFPSNFPYTNLSPSHFTVTGSGAPGVSPPANGVRVSSPTSPFVQSHPPRVWGQQ
ncbi:hypothetical protein EIP91_002064 [Steccherinum ochraceum]|uniref:SANT domain-containing protein n=1 Tax=Steccherinum ochraceum TaxID=92696 RepID=A0A4R0RXE8_9APHY|nr:hypothetical protein EIP91_002064 [Steccherinum ochraceum]